MNDESRMMNNTAPKAIEKAMDVENGVGCLSVPADGPKSVTSFKVPNINTKKKHSRKKSMERKILTGGQIVHGGARKAH
jgi:hypothetical protein